MLLVRNKEANELTSIEKTIEIKFFLHAKGAYPSRPILKASALPS